MDKDTLLFEMTLGEELPGILTRYVGASEKQRTVGYHNGVLQELKPGRRHTVADVWQTFVGDFACTWVAQMPCDPLAFAITLRANANDQLVDLTALLNVQVNDPVAFTRWVCYKVWGEGPYRATSLVFTTSDLRPLVIDAVEQAVDSVTRQIPSSSLLDAEASKRVWNAVLTALAPQAANWGLMVQPAPGMLLFANTSVATLAKAQRLAELDSRLGDIALDAQMSAAQRDAALQDFQRNLTADLGGPIGEVASGSELVASSATQSPEQMSRLRGLARKVGAALSARVERELRQRADALTRRVGGDISTKDAGKPATDEEEQPWWQTALQIVKVLAALASLGSTVYFVYRQASSTNTLNDPVSYLGQIVASFVGFVLSITALPFIQKRLRHRPAPLERNVEVWGINERRDLNEKLLAQVLRQLDQVLRSLTHAHRAAGERNLLEDAVCLNENERQINDLAMVIRAGRVGAPAYLLQEHIELPELERLLNADDALLDASQCLVDCAHDLDGKARTSANLRPDSTCVEDALNILRTRLDARTTLMTHVPSRPLN